MYPIRVEQCFSALANADAMLIVGSSLMVYSGFRFVRAAQRADIPIAAVNLGKTRADELLTLKVRLDCATALNSVLSKIDPGVGLIDKTKCDAVPR